MGKRANPQGLRLVQNKEWISNFYSDSFNYSNIISQDYLIYDFIINYMSQQTHIHVCKIRIWRKDHRIFIYMDFLNDLVAQSRPKFFAQRRLLRFFRRRSFFVKRRLNLYDKKNPTGYLNFKYPGPIGVASVSIPGLPLEKWVHYPGLSPYFLCESNLNRKRLFFHRLTTQKDLRSARQSLAFRLSLLVKAPVILKTNNIATPDTSLFRTFSKMAVEKDMKRAPMYRAVTVRVIYLIYHAIRFQSSLLLCRYLAKFLPSYCKKRRKERRIFPFFRFLSNVFKLLDLRGFLRKTGFKGIRLCFKGRYNGMRRKKKFTISRGNLSINTFEDNVSYCQAHAFTLFGVTGIKVWIISNKECSSTKKETQSNIENSI